MKYLLATLVFLSSLCFGQSTVPFKTTDGLILIQAEIDGHQSTMLLDSGAARTFINASSAGALRQAKGAHGFTGEPIAAHVDIKIGNRLFPDFDVMLANVDDISNRIGYHIDGIIGETILSQFVSVNIDYSRKIVIFK